MFGCIVDMTNGQLCYCNEGQVYVASDTKRTIAKKNTLRDMLGALLGKVMSRRKRSHTSRRDLGGTLAECHVDAGYAEFPFDGATCRGPQSRGLEKQKTAKKTTDKESHDVIVKEIKGLLDQM